MPLAELPPDLVLVLFLPPLLFQEAFPFSPRELRANAHPIALLAVGLVLATTIAVAAVAHALAPGLPWGPRSRWGRSCRDRPAGRDRHPPAAGRAPAHGHRAGGREPGQRRDALVAYRLAVAAVVAGYAAYPPADRLGVSGVLAAVAAGLYLGRRAPELASPATRLLGPRSGRCWSTCSTRSCSCWSASSSTPS